MSDAPGSGPSDTRRLVLMALLAAWILAFGYAFVHYATSTPTGDGFTRGANRVSGFLGWHGVAGVISLAAFGVSRAWARGHAIRKFATVAFAIAVIEALTLVGLIFWASRSI